MNCDEVRPLLAAHLDGELDVVRDADVVAHLNTCTACADAALAHAARRSLIVEKLTRYAAPAGLRASIRAALPTAAPVARAPWWMANRQVFPLAATFVVAIGLGFTWGGARARRAARLDEVVSSYVRSNASGHAIDVISTDRHTVKPWFAGKLDFAPPVYDLASAGFPLVGGRVDRIHEQTAAVLIYNRRKHVIDLYITPDAGASLPAETTTSGFNLVSWTAGGQRFVAISDLAAPELADFARQFQQAN